VVKFAEWIVGLALPESFASPAPVFQIRVVRLLAPPTLVTLIMVAESPVLVVGIKSVMRATLVLSLQFVRILVGVPTPNAVKYVVFLVAPVAMAKFVIREVVSSTPIALKRAQRTNATMTMAAAAYVPVRREKFAIVTVLVWTKALATIPVAGWALNVVRSADRPVAPAAKVKFVNQISVLSTRTVPRRVLWDSVITPMVAGEFAVVSKTKPVMAVTNA
jgi:hypothetical protein